MTDKNLTENLADLAHQQWSGWMEYLFQFGQETEDGSFTITSEKAERWRRQIKTSYADLSESEKESDRREARKVMQLLYAANRGPKPFYWLRNSPRFLHYLVIRLFGAKHLPCPLCGEQHKYRVELPNGERVEVWWSSENRGLVVSGDSEFFGCRYPLEQYVLESL